MSTKQICTVKGCLEKKTKYKKSAFCAPHTCQDLFCKQPTARLQEYCPRHGGSRRSIAPIGPTDDMMRPTSVAHEIKKVEKKIYQPDYSCVVPHCKEKKACRDSNFCWEHRCDYLYCRNVKMNTHPRYCDSHKCDGPDCPHERYTNNWPGTSFCLYHACNKCHRKLAVLGPCSIFKYCLDCGVRCGVIGCDLPSTDNNSRYCETHRCRYPQCDLSVEGSFRDRPAESDFCQKHRCIGCQGVRVEQEDLQYCSDCFSHCISCRTPRPSDYKGHYYYCDQHGCTDCHSFIKHRYEFLRQRIQSEKCRQHTMFPSMPETMKWTKEMRKKAGELNKNIHQKEDAQTYNLTCQYYCSDGWCKCNLMPTIARDCNIEEKGVSLRGEHVFILSDTANGEEGRYAWTIPRSGTSDMIRFELLRK